ncbi:DUF2570 domain-containing protein [Pasteurellaceae bacterium TAE3-ERU1]|uniref:DUF2570 family protein n=1 Tax=Spirabiliibacterium mucosae TaxID=28156 RepID=UPI001AACABD5|nr:DUF2570 family protein [Spirabiliibacterium mucosae]MBE2898094.1 DUF2570 family protein [Spirabiliibacterium mucosae]MBV7388980.1 DUF2570 domain-containing protein [Pasteurellaceae bacterium TAE3-ERU1]
MFKLDLKLTAILSVIAIMALGSLYVSSIKTKLSHYQSLSIQQAEQLKTLQQSLERKDEQLKQEREATEKQTAIESKSTEKAQADNEVIRQSLLSQDCAHRRLPDDVIKRLRTTTN